MNKESFVCSDCAVTRSMASLGTRWKPPIIYALRERTMRFGQLAAHISIISRKALTDSLRELEHDGIVVRQEFKELPPRVEYSLTDKGRELVPILVMLSDWNQRHQPSEETSPAV